MGYILIQIIKALCHLFIDRSQYHVLHSTFPWLPTAYHVGSTISSTFSQVSTTYRASLISWPHALAISQKFTTEYPSVYLFHRRVKVSPTRDLHFIGVEEDKACCTISYQISYGPQVTSVIQSQSSVLPLIFNCSTISYLPKVTAYKERYQEAFIIPHNKRSIEQSSHVWGSAKMSPSMNKFHYLCHHIQLHILHLHSRDCILFHFVFKHCMEDLTPNSQKLLSSPERIISINMKLLNR